MALTADEIERIDSEFVSELTLEHLKDLHDELHAYAEEHGVNEPVLNAHVFVWLEFQERGIEHAPQDNELDQESRFWVQEYPVLHKEEREEEKEPITLEEFVSALPKEFKVSERPEIYISGGLRNRGYTVYDIDIRIKSADPDPALMRAFLSQLPEKYRERIHFVWDDSEVAIGHLLPIYSRKYEKMPLRVIHKDVHFEKASVRLGEPFKPPKPRSGWMKFEFHRIEDLWENWAKDRIDAGIFCQPKYDGIRFVVHKKGNKVWIYTEDKARDRAHVFDESIKELLKLDHDFIIDTEMVEFKIGEKELPGKQWPEQVFEQYPREDLVKVDENPYLPSATFDSSQVTEKWVGAKDPGPDRGVVFHVHDIAYLDGKDLTKEPYWRRLKILEELLPEDFKHWDVPKTWYAGSKRTFFEACEKARRWPASEGAMAKTGTGLYELDGETAEVAKLKNYKALDLIVLDTYTVRSKETGKPIGTYNYTVGFLVPKGMEEGLDPKRLRKIDGKTYMVIGQTYNTPHKLKVGEILEIQTIRVREYETKDGKRYFTFMFPRTVGPRPDKDEPDALPFIEQLARLGTKPLRKDVIIYLEDCPYYKNSSICPLWPKYEHPWEYTEFNKGSIVLAERLRWPISCPFADTFRCRYVKRDYYVLKPDELE